MDVVTHIKACLDRWSTGGREECQSTLTSPHCHISDPACADVLATTYQTLLHNIIKTWSTSSGTRLEAADVASFIQSVLTSLPSTSSASAERSRNLVLFGELFVDLVWAIDSELDEVISDAKSVIAHIIAEREKRKKEKANAGVTADADEKAEELEKEKMEKEKMDKAEEMQKVADGDKGTLAELMKLLLEASIVDAAICRERLDVAIISEIGLILDRINFERKEVRSRTGLFYKQNKFNLLREQSEGYTKLTTDLIASLGPPNIAATATPVESLNAVQARAAAVWERVVTLIGYFDLDPNRALDIILDVFSVNIATHWQFFLSLLACSPWVGEHTGLQDWENAASMKVDTQEHPYRGKSLDEVLLNAESRVRGSRPPKSYANSKQKVLAQVLGFKFNHYQSPETKATCPRGLYLAAALLIREEFICIEDLFPHLSPSEADMPGLHQKYLDGVQDRIKSSSNNLLTMAAPLESSTMGSSSKSKPLATESKATNEVKEPPPQKAMLVVALLSVGVLRPAIALMTRYPWLINIQRELADLLMRVLKASISPLYDKIKERNKGFSQPRARYPTNSTSTVLVTPMRAPQLTLCAPSPPSTLTHDFIFFYPRWSEWVPVCETADDVIDIVGPLLGFVGLYISRDAMFITKLMRIAKIHLKTDAESRDTMRPLPPITEPESPAQAFWLDVIRRYLLPALSMLPGNAVCTVEVWTVLRLYDVSIRWRLYGEWRDHTYQSHPELNAQYVLREREAKGILRRLSSQTVDNLAGTVAKMAHTNPCIFFTNAVKQIQAYDNLADVVIQALRFSTNMGFDVLVFIVIDALANPNKERVKEDGANASDWLQSLATFSGALLRRYATDSSSLLKYIVHQLYSGQTTEIIVLEKLILRMAGIEPLPSLSDTQIVAMAGGPTLRIEAVGSDLRGAGLDVTEASTKGPQRLGKTLIDTKLAFPILVQVAQQRQACVFKAKDAYLKSIAYLFDATHGVLFQYLDLITTPSVISLEDYRQIIPPLSELSGVYGVSPPIAMQIYRPMLNDAIAKHASEWCKAEEAAKIERAEAAEKRLKAALAAKREMPAASNEGAPTESTSLPEAEPELNGSADLDTMEIDTSGQDAQGNTRMVTNGVLEAKVDQPPWLPELYALFADCKQIAPGNAYDVIGPGFYLTFWQMSGYDLHYPKEKYAEVEKSLQASGEMLYNKARQAERSSDKSTRSSATIHRQQRERYNSTILELRKEKSAQEIVYRYTTEKNGRLDREKAFWFSHVGAGDGKGATFIQSLIEHCIQPRCLLSPMDAVYCARLIRTLHERGTPNFHTLMCYNKLLGEHVKVVIFSCSENEARNYGRFLKGILQDLYGWHKDQKVYDASNRRKDGSEITILPGLQTQLSKDGPPTPDDLLKWPDFKSFLKKCHRKLGRCFSECIQAGDFMHVYNAVLVLKEIIEVFPVAAVNEVVGATIDHEVQKLVQNEERGDLKILARAYYSSLKKREKIWAMQKNVQPIKPSLIKKGSTQNLTEKPTASLPTGPRASLSSLPVAPERAPPVERPSSAAKLALESIPRPEVVKRNRDSRPPEAAPQDSSKKEQPEPMQVDQQPNTQGRPHHKPPTASVESSSRPKEDIQVPQPSIPSRPSGRILASHPSTDLRKEVLQGMNGGSRPATPLPSSQSTLSQNGSKELPQSSPRHRDHEPGPPMAPPAEPSQTVQAHELRSSRRSERRSPRESRSDLVDSPARRSSSPATRPGTRNASVDSRASGEGRRDRIRHDRSFGEDSKRSANVDMPSRAERGSGTHRDVLNGRGGRDRIPGSSTRDGDRERELDRERGRDREKDRDREREKRDRGERESHRDRDRERDRDRGDRDKDRDRHRRDERERDRDRKSSSTKDLEIATEHSLPSRPDGSRHRAHTSSVHPDDILLGKRRRGVEEEQPDPRGNAKRSSRRRASDKETSPTRRESDRRRKDRDSLQSESSFKNIGTEKPYDRSRGIDSSSTSPTLKIDVPPPSAPRAMAAPSPRAGGRGDTSPVVTSAREKEQDRDRGKRDRSDRASRGESLHVDRDGWVDKIDKPERSDRDERERGRRGDRVGKGDREWKEGPGIGLQNGSSSLPTGSLKDRIGAMPPAPPGTSSGRSGIGENSGREDHSDRLKRTVTDREKDTSHESQLTGTNTSQPPPIQKRFRIDRNRVAGDSGTKNRTVRQ